MKNSLFKRAVAAAAAVPLALTQCLTYSVAAEEEAKNDTANVAVAEDPASSKSFTLDNILYIAPDKTESEWNFRVSNMIDQLIADGKDSGVVGKKVVIDEIVKNAKSYSALAEAVLAKVGDVNYKFDDDKNLIVTVKIDNISEALQGDFLYSLGSLNNKLADKYGDESLRNIDYTTVKAGGTATFKIYTSALADGTTVEAEASLAALDGQTYASPLGLLTYAANVINGYTEAAKKAVDASSLTDEQKKAAYDDIEKNINKYVRVVRFANDKYAKFMSYENTATSIAELYEYVNNFGSRYTKRDIPDSTAEAANKALVKKLFAEAKDEFNELAAPYTLDIEANEIAEFIDKDLTNVKASASNGDLDFYAEFPDAEADEVADWYAKNVKDKEYVSSYKFIKINVNATNYLGLKGSADVQIKRVVVTKDKTTETTSSTTSSTTTSSSTTSSSTTSDITTTTTALAVADVYVDYDADYGFYTEQDKSFAAEQVENFKLYATYDQYYLTDAGMKVSVGKTEPVAIDGAKFAFASTPAETYSTETFKHDIALVAAADITDEAGNVLVKAGSTFKTNDGADAKVEVYVGLKGDTNLDNKVNGVDASYVLVYYTKLSEGDVDSNKVVIASENELTTDPAGIYDNFAAFLADVNNEIPADQAWAIGKVSRKDASIQRSLTAIDASNILVFAAAISDGEADTAAAWANIFAE